MNDLFPSWDYKNFAELASIATYNPEKWPMIRESLARECLDDEKDLFLYDTLNDLFSENMLTSETVLTKLKGQFKLGSGWAIYSGAVMGGPCTLNPKPWIRGITEDFFSRKKRDITNGIAKAALSQNDSAINRLTSELARLGDQEFQSEKKTNTVADLMNNTFDHFEEILKKEPGITSGYPRLDSVITGFQPGNFYILAARPGIGKTACALNFAAQGAKSGADVVFFSLEMPSYQIGQRLIARLSGIENRRMQSPSNLNERELDLIVEAAKEYGTYKGHFCLRSGSYTFAQIEMELELIAAHLKPKVVFIDYLTIIRTPPGHSREREIGELSSSLKRLALSKSIAVVCLAQPNREMERQDRMPRNSDLRDSGQIEQDADLIMWVHREKSDSGLSQDTSILVTKNRHGPVCNISGFFFDPGTQLLKN